MTIEDVPDILEFEKSRLPGEGIEKEMQTWHAVWRQEALEHYARLGWSFIFRTNGKVEGYVLTQPILFFKGWTQALWVEHISATTEELTAALFDIAYRWARDKHFQKVYFSENLQFLNKEQRPLQNDGALHSVASAKI